MARSLPREFGRAVEAVGARRVADQGRAPELKRLRPERAQLTILEECWRPAFARSLAPKITALAVTSTSTWTSSTSTAPQRPP